MKKLISKLNPLNLFRGHFSDPGEERRFQHLRKYASKPTISEEEAELIRGNLYVIAIPEFGGSITAKLSPIGREIYDRLCIQRIPITNFFYCWKNAVFD